MLEQIFVEAYAYPFASLEALLSGVAELATDDVGQPIGFCADLAGGFERRFRWRRSPVSLDELRQTRANAWFDVGDVSGDARMPLDRLLRLAADKLLGAYGGEIRPHPPKEGLTPPWDTRAGVEPRLWQGIARQIPADILAAACALQQNLIPGCHSIRPILCIVPPFLQSRLAQLGIADLHVHYGAAVSPAAHWRYATEPNRTWRELRRRSPRGDIRDGVPIELDAGQSLSLLRLLLVASTVRSLLIWYVDRRARPGVRSAPIGSFYEEVERLAASPPPGSPRACRRDAALWLYDTATSLEPGRIMDTALAPVRPNELSRLRYVAIAANRLTNPAAWDFRYSNPSQALPDPAEERYGVTNATGWPAEAYFIYNALDLIEQDRRAGVSSGIETPFWQLVRVRCALHQYLVQSQGAAGLGRFAQIYDRGNLVELPEEEAVRNAVDTISPNQLVKSIELRAAPRSDRRALARRVRGMLEGYRDLVEGRGADGVPALSLTFHLIKDDTDQRASGQGRPHALADPADGVYWRHRRLYKKYYDEVHTILRLLEQSPSVAMLLTGLDAANRELTVPSWVYAPLIRGFRREANKLPRRWNRGPRSAQADPRDDVGGQAPDPITTFHAGEDYRHLAEGLRRVWEAGTYLCTEPGDRIGHGLALGEDPEWRPRQTCQRITSAEARLEDLLFEWHIYAVEGERDDLGVLPELERRIRRLARQIFGTDDADDPVQLWRAYVWRHEPDELLRRGVLMEGPRFRELPYPDRGQSLGGGGAEALLKLYLTDPGVWHRGRQSTVVQTTPREAERMHKLQRWVQRRVSHLTVECNPTSNVVIRRYDDYTEHPLLRLFPPGQSHPVGPVVTINCDDPLTFVTNTANELAHMFQAAGRSTDLTPAERWEWLRRMIDDGYAAAYRRPSTSREDGDIIRACLDEL
jgi:hypothetical protein